MRLNGRVQPPASCTARLGWGHRRRRDGPAGVPQLDCYESAETKLSALAVRHGAVHLDRPKVHMYMYTFIAFIHAIDKCIGSKAIF